MRSCKGHRYQSAGVLGDMWSMDLATMKWTNIMPADSPAPRYAFGFVSWSSKLYIFGGFGGFNSSSRGLIASFHLLKVMRESIYSRLLSTGYLNDLVEVDPLEATWTQIEIAGQLPPARRNPGIAVADGLLCIFGGNSRFCELNMIMLFDSQFNFLRSFGSLLQ